MFIDNKLQVLGIKLEDVNSSTFPFVPVIRTGELVYTSGQDCRENGVNIFEGKIGKDISLVDGQKAARQCAINCLSVLKCYLGSLDKVKQVVKVSGFVQSYEGFWEQPYVMNGASDIFIDVFGEKGRHVRSAIGVNELPFNTPVEVEVIVEVENNL
ncbi:MAG TPA: RidA family protein [Virgibacillus sp.]|nr:RidA family protein [Virgibacillus sp.]HLR68261.1 RidA family protein [Virgibacillus sp.]